MKTSVMMLCAALPAAAVPPATSVTLDLHPIARNGAVTAVDVAMTFSAGKRDGFELTAPIVYPGVAGVADRMTSITAQDAKGSVTLVPRDDAAVPGGFSYSRHWTAARAVAYPVRIRYRGLVQPPGGANGPPFGMRAVGGGVAGALATLLITPDDPSTTPVRVRWDLAAFPPGAIGSTSAGDGDFVAPEGLAGLKQGWFLAGPAGQLAVNAGFSAAWLGTPTFDAPAAMREAARGHAYLVRYFPHLKPAAPYRVFLQFRGQAPYGGGTALDRSFMYTRGPLKPGETPQPPLGTIFHEMIHQWVGQIEMPEGEASWFAEGLTSYYETELPLRGGFQSVADYGERINSQTAQYFDSKARNWSAAAIAKIGFGDEAVRRLPYRRGELYFHDLDARIRARSNGKRNLDSLLFPMFVARETGQRFDRARWVAMVSRELGAGEGQRFQHIVLDGTETLVPRPDAFGPCFTLSKSNDATAAYRWVRVPGVPHQACKLAE